MAKKVKENDSVVVSVDNDVTSVSMSKDVNHCGIDAVAESISEVPDAITKKRKASKRVSDIALETKISDMEKALDNAKNVIETTVAENERLSDELQSNVSENRSLRKELSKVKQDYKKAQGDNRANSALIETLNSDLTRVKTRNNELTATIGRLQDKIKQYADELSVKDKEISDLQFDSALCTSKLSNSDAMLSKYKSMTLWQRIRFVFLKEKVFSSSKK